MNSSTDNISAGQSTGFKKEPLTFIFIGRSGCGKGTQIDLLTKFIKNEEIKSAKNIEDETGFAPEPREIFALETGESFRHFLDNTGKYGNTPQTATQKIASDVYSSGARQPDFLAIWMWADAMVEKFNLDSHLIVDGSPRSLDEAKILDTAIKFYKRENPFVVYLNVSQEWSRKHLLSRGREDDIDIAMIQKRLDWYQKDVIPAVDFFKDNDGYNFLQINGEQPIEKVHRDLINEILARA